jgi:hypothetical protein
MQRSLIANSKHRVGRHAVVGLLAVLASSTFAVSALGATQPLPAASTGGVSSVTPSSAVLHGSVDAKTHPTNYVFQYGTTKFYGGQTTLAPGGQAASTIQVSQAIGGLQANTIYHYRILATSASGSTTGVDRTFKTPKVPLSLQIGGAPNPVAFGDPFAVQGTLSGTGNAGRVVALQTNPFPYTAGFKTLGNFEVTNSIGGFSFPVVGLLDNTQLRVVTTSAPYVTSPVVVEGVAVQVSLHVRRVHRPRRGEFVRFYGTITPAQLGAHVGFQLLRHGAPSINQGGTIVVSGTPSVSRFSTVVRIRHRGVYEALVQVFDGSHVSSYSQPIRIG